MDIGTAICGGLFGPNALCERPYVVSTEVSRDGKSITYVYNNGKRVTVPMNTAAYVQEVEKSIPYASEQEAIAGRQTVMTGTVGKNVTVVDGPNPLLLGGSKLTTFIVLAAAALILYVALKR